MARGQVLGLPRMVSLDLTLTEGEARELMAMMQNPLGDQHPDEESENQRNVRAAIFDPLHSHFHGNQRNFTPEGPLTGEAKFHAQIRNTTADAFPERAARELEGWGWRDKADSLGSGIIEG